MTHAPRVVLTVVVFGLAVMTAPTIQAQTPATTVKDSDENVVFQSNTDGGLLAPGTFGTGTIPAEGTGTRMMWYPAKGAVRAGRVGFFPNTEENWNTTNVGDYSVAFGVDTKASNNATTAMGQGTTASGERATAMGRFSTASGDEATAMGNDTFSSGFAATAMGDATTASANASAAMGFRTVAATRHSLTIGLYNERNRGNDDSDPSTGPLFVIGNGSSSQSRSDAFYVNRSGEAFAKGGHSAFSDRRLKTSIEPVGDGTLAKLTDLRPVRYQFKDQSTHPSGEQVGLVAQDVRKEFPQLVSEGANGMLSLAYPKLTAVLVKGLQEQQAQIDSLRRRTERIDKVEKRLAILEAARTPATAGWVGGVPLRGLALLLIGGVLGAGLLHLRRR